MAKMNMAGDGMATCNSASKSCAVPCLAAGNCQSHCGSLAPFVQADRHDLALPQFSMVMHVTEGKEPPGTDSPVDGPPPRF
jgi:hypothetical protein